MESDDRECVMLVDSTNFLYRGHFAMFKADLRAKDGTPTGALTAFLSTLSKGFAATGAQMAVCVFDPKGGADSRRALASDYKSNRPATPDDLRVQIELAKQVVPALGHPAIEVAGYEADDVLAAMAKTYSSQGVRVVIASGDKDMLQCVDENVGIWLPGAESVEGAEAAQKKFGVPPFLVPAALALCGDAVDCIRGADGVGPKTASKLLMKYGSLQAILDDADNIPGKLGESLVAAREWLPMSFVLASARLDAPIPELSELRSKSGVDLPVLEAFATRLGIRSLRSVCETARAPRLPGF